jgi:hypothetical protein
MTVTHIASFMILSVENIENLPSKTSKIKAFNQMVLHKYQDRSIIYFDTGSTGLYKVKLTKDIPDNGAFYDDIELALYLFNIIQESEMAINWVKSNSHYHEFYADYVKANKKSRIYNHNQLLKQLLCQSIGGEFVELSVITILQSVLKELDVIPYDPITNSPPQLNLNDRLKILYNVIKPLGHNNEFINKYVFLYAMEQFLKLRKI